MARTGTDWHPRDVRDEKLAAALAAGSTYAEAAERAGLSLRTAKRHGVEPCFAAYVDSLRENVARLIAKRLDELAADACDVLGELMADGGEGAKLGAAKAVLAHMTRLGEHADLTERVESLERARGLRAVS